MYNNYGITLQTFQFQACRGHNLDHGVEVADASEEPEDNVQIRRIPSEADFLMFYSTVPGKGCITNDIPAFSDI